MTSTDQAANTKKYWWAIGLIAVVIAAILLEPLLPGGDDGSETPEEAETPAVTESPSGPSTPPLSVADQEAAEESAALGVQAFTQYSWQDPSHDSWINRLAKVSTTNYIKSVRTQFPDSYDAKQDWKFDVVTPKRETRTAVDEVAFQYSGDGEFADEDHQHFDDTTTSATFVVSYTTSVRDINSPDWTDPVESLYKEVTVVKVTPDGLKCGNGSDCVWRVNGIRETDDGGDVA